MATATYNASVTSVAAAGAAIGTTITHCQLWRSRTGANVSDPMMGFQLTSTQQALTAGQSLNVAADAFVFTLSAGALQDDGEEACLEGMFEQADVYMTFHTGASGTAGTTNRVTALGSVILDKDDWTIASS